MNLAKVQGGWEIHREKIKKEKIYRNGRRKQELARRTNPAVKKVVTKLEPLFAKYRPPTHLPGQKQVTGANRRVHIRCTKKRDLDSITHKIKTGDSSGAGQRQGRPKIFALTL